MYYWLNISQLNSSIMKKNMGTADRIIRLVIVIIIATLYFTGTISGTVAIVLGVLAVIFALTSLVSTCPLYMPFGLSTCKTEEAPD
ncbi:MAG: hypothetical protein BalsKO_13340 [Balneolaceae bacterium]